MSDLTYVLYSGLTYCYSLPLVSRYWRFNEQSRAVDKDYPKPISVWGSAVPSSPKGAFLSDDGGERGERVARKMAVMNTLNKGEGWVWSIREREGASCRQYELSREKSDIILKG